jgi:hypothetical protein
MGYDKRHRIRRIERIFEYSGLVVAGIFFTASPSPAISDMVTKPGQVSFSVAMIVGALICLWGSVTDRWLGEYSGIFLLSSSLFFYGGVVFKTYADNSDKVSTTILGLGLIFTSFGLALIARWNDVRRIKRQASQSNEQIGD